MLVREVIPVALKRRPAGEPFIDGDAQGVLIAGAHRVLHDLLGGHVSPGSNLGEGLLRVDARRGGDDAEVAEQDVITLADEHVVGLDVAVDEFFVVRVLLGGGDLFDILDDGRQRDARASWMAFLK